MAHTPADTVTMPTGPAPRPDATPAAPDAEPPTEIRPVAVRTPAAQVPAAAVSPAAVPTRPEPEPAGTPIRVAPQPVPAADPAPAVVAATPAPGLAPDAAPPPASAFDLSALSSEPTLEVRSSRPEAPARTPEPPVPMRDLPQAMMVRAQAVAATLPPGGEARTEITLSPAELGRITLTIRAGEDGLVVQIAADRPETLDLARRHADAFDRAAAEANLRMRLEVGGDGQPHRQPGAWGGRAGGAGIATPFGATVGGDPVPHAPPAAQGRLDLRL